MCPEVSSAGARLACKLEVETDELLYEMKSNCGGNADFKLPGDAGFVGDIASMRASVLRLEMKDTLCIVLCV